MDLIIWHWSESEKKIVVNNLDSQFMGQSQAKVLVKRMKKFLSQLDPHEYDLVAVMVDCISYFIIWFDRAVSFSVNY